MDYLTNAKKTLNFWWKYKYLWLIGVIASIFTSSSFNFSEFGESFDPPSTSSTSILPDSFSQVEDEVLLIIGITCLVVALIWIAFTIYFGNTAKTALIKAVPVLESGDNLSFTSLWKLGNPYWLKRFFLQVLVFSPLIILGIVFGIGAFIISLTARSSPEFIEAFACAFLPVAISLICLLGIYALFVGMILPFAERELVLNNRGIWNSVAAGWHFFKTNFIDLLVCWLLSWVVGIVNLIISSVFIGGFLLVFFGIILAGFGGEVNVTVAVLGIFATIFFFAITLRIALGPTFALTSEYWTITFLTLQKKTKEEKG